MPVRSFDRVGTWLFPPTLEECLAADHPARFVAAVVDALTAADWGELGVGPRGAADGPPAYDPRVLLGVWLYGFMTGVRSSRKLEAGCRDSFPYLWLTGWQFPDHTTLWRFYQAHRAGMRTLFRRSVRTAVRAGLVDLAVQAVDGTKIQGNAAKERTYDQAGLERLLGKLDASIADLEAQNTGGDEPVPPRLPKRLAEAEALKDQVETALAAVRAEEGPARINLTDGDAQLMKGRQGMVAGYNAQAMVSPLDPEAAGGRTGRLITGQAVVQDPDDHSSLVPMLAVAEQELGVRAAMTLADGGYHSGPNLVACGDREQPVVMPEAQGPRVAEPYHKEQFTYDAAADTYTCPEGQVLHFRGLKQPTGEPAARMYAGAPRVCRACPAFGVCTKNRHEGRTLKVGPDEAALREHRAWMATDTAKEAYRQRKVLPEPVFGILKEQMGARRFLLRGLEHVQAEWALLATAFNLRTLYRIWAARPPESRWELVGSVGGA